MKRNLIICALLCIAMILIPLFVMKSSNDNESSDVEVFAPYDGYVSVMKSENGKVLKMDEREYIIGMLAAEADMDYHDEALKAIAVAGRTYMLCTRNRNLADELNGADISDDPQTHQGYLDAEARKKKWGDDFETNEERAGEIADSVSGKAIYYDNELVSAVYHKLNCGKTIDAETVWGVKIPYLISVESPGDKLSADYEFTAEFSTEEFDSLIEKIDGVKLNKTSGQRIGEVEKNSTGYVKSVDFFGNTISSEDFRSALGLKSCCFDISSDEETVSITTYGNGHMVGMSQYGADYMARQGADFEEILRFYYSNVEIR